MNITPEEDECHYAPRFQYAIIRIKKTYQRKESKMIDKEKEANAITNLTLALSVAKNLVTDADILERLAKIEAEIRAIVTTWREQTTRIGE